MVNAGPRKGWNTDTLLSEAARGAESAGAELVKFDLFRLEKQGYLNRVRPDSNERKLFLSLTAEGEALKDQALAVPRQMRSWIDLPEEELRQLKCLLERTLIKLEETTDGKESLV